MPIQTISSSDSSQQHTLTTSVQILEEWFRLASDGRLTDAERSHLWALVAAGDIQHETAHLLVKMDEQGRRRWANRRRSKPHSTRQEMRRALAADVPTAIRGTANLTLAREALLGLYVRQAKLINGRWRVQISISELERLLGNASRRTVREAIKAVESRGLVFVIRRCLTPRFDETNVYVLAHPALVEAAEKRAAKRPQRRTGGVLSDPGVCRATPPPEKVTKRAPRARESARCRVLQGVNRRTPAPTPAPAVQTDTGHGAKARPPEPGLPANTIQRLLRCVVSNPDALADTDYWRIAESLLATELAKFDRKTWTFARFRHGNRAALAVIETVLVTRYRARNADRIRSPVAYLGGILKRPPEECLPEISLQRLAAKTDVRLDIPQALAG